MQKSENIRELAAALAKAQAAFLPICRDKTVKVKTRTGGEYKFSYAPLESIMAAIKQGLADNGLCILQSIVSVDKSDYIETTVLHASGESIANMTPVLVMENGPQAYGSAVTYARRYGVTTLLCLVADDDDDANGAEGNSMQPASRGAATPAPKPATKRSTYSEEQFSANLPTWTQLISSGKRTPEEIIATVEAKAPLSDGQKATIRGLQSQEAVS